MRFPRPHPMLMTRASAEGGEAIEKWHTELASIIEDRLSEWALEWTGEDFPQGYMSYVLPCRTRDGVPHVLKLDAHGSLLRREAVALRCWRELRAARVVREAYDECGGALLLTRISPGWHYRPETDVRGHLLVTCLRQLSGARVTDEACRELPDSATQQRALLRVVAPLASELALDRGHRAVVERCDRLSAETDSERRVVVHGDLGPTNILHGPDGLWVVDPLGYLAPPEREVAEAAVRSRTGQPLASRVRRLAGMCGADPELAVEYCRIAAWCTGLLQRRYGPRSPVGPDPHALLEFAHTG